VSVSVEINSGFGDECILFIEKYVIAGNPFEAILSSSVLAVTTQQTELLAYNHGYEI
jgi:hypothetical protein